MLQRKCLLYIPEGRIYTLADGLGAYRWSKQALQRLRTMTTTPNQSSAQANSDLLLPRLPGAHVQAPLPSPPANGLSLLRGISPYRETPAASEVTRVAGRQDIKYPQPARKQPMTMARGSLTRTTPILVRPDSRRGCRKHATFEGVISQTAINEPMLRLNGGRICLAVEPLLACA